jgi:hypothetical protein
LFDQTGRIAVAVWLALTLGSPVWGMKPSLDSSVQLGASAAVPECAADSTEIVSLKRFCPPVFQPETRLALSYYHPLAQQQVFSRNHSGPDGWLYLPDYRQLETKLDFTILTGDERRLISPESAGASLTVFFSPGKIREEWVWPDGLALTRICFQAPNFPAVGIRFALHNGGHAPQGGLRLEACLQNPEITERLNNKPAARAEEDDELITDPRTGTLYQHDWITREPTWLAIGWSPEGGLISTGANQQESQPQDTQDSAGVTVRIETPAQDLSPDQAMAPVFWVTWGNDREAATRSLDKLRIYSGFSRWEEQVKDYSSQGMSFHCKDAYLCYLFQSLKSWVPWMVRTDTYGRVSVMPIDDPEWVLPEKAAAGMAGLMAFAKPESLEGYLDYWLDQRTEDPSGAYTLIMACRYYQVTGDRAWLDARRQRITNLLLYLESLDQDRDSLPEYTFPAEANSRALFQPEKNSGQMQLAEAELATIRAFRCGADMLEQCGSVEARRFRQKAEAMTAAFQAQYWEAGMGKKGYFLYGRVADQNLIDRHRDAGIADVVLHGIGKTDYQDAVFEELWNNPNWRTPKGRFRNVPSDDPGYRMRWETGQGLVNFQRTHDILLSGLVRPATATEAVRRLMIYSRETVQDPKMMALPGADTGRPSTLDVTALNLIDLITLGLCGLEVDCQGMRVHIPSYNQELDAEIRQFIYRGALINVRVNGAGGGKGQITVNGRAVEPGTYIPKEAFSKGRVIIRIDRFPKKEPSRYQKRAVKISKSKR